MMMCVFYAVSQPIAVPSCLPAMVESGGAVSVRDRGEHAGRIVVEIARPARHSCKPGLPQRGDGFDDPAPNFC
jgi:hypothetical protein